MEPLVSVIIPTYKGEDYIKETLNSVLKQTYTNIETIVIVDGSPDDTFNTLQNFNPRVKVVLQENQGIAGARNTGLDKAKGDFICFLDHDDIWHPGKVESQLKIFEKKPEVGVIYGNFILWQGGEYPFTHDSLDPEKFDKSLSGYIYHRLLETNYVLFSTAMFRKSELDKVGNFNLSLPIEDDWDLNIRLSRITQFYKQDDTVALYRIHDNQTSQKTPMRNYEAEFRQSCIEKYGLLSPDGRLADQKSLKKRFYKSDFDFAYAHYIAGNYDLSAKRFFQLNKQYPIRIKLYLFTLRSLIISMLRKAQYFMYSSMQQK